MFYMHKGTVYNLAAFDSFEAVEGFGQFGSRVDFGKDGRRVCTANVDSFDEAKELLKKNVRQMRVASASY